MGRTAAVGAEARLYGANRRMAMAARQAREDRKSVGEKSGDPGQPAMAGGGCGSYAGRAFET